MSKIKAIKVGNIRYDLSVEAENVYYNSASSGGESTDTHEYVDLGLPSGTLWATMNVGAESETDYGNYYMYGKGATQYNSSDAPYSGTEDPLDSSVDTARQVWGGSWHMPTQTQIQELIDNTTYQWVTNYKSSGKSGGTFTATNGAVLFLPAAGYWDDGGQYGVGDFGDYWGSSPNGSGNAYILGFNDDDKFVYDDVRKFGFSVRPVIDSAPSGSSMTLTEKIEDIEDSLEGKADLVSGKVPASQLPSYVDDVIEGYYNTSDGKFYESKSGSTYSTEITAETGKIYVDLDSNKTFRWSGSAYIEISSGPDIMGASGSNHKSGLVPDTGSTAGTNKYLREDAQWVAQASTSDISALNPPTGELDPQDWEDEIANKLDKIDANNKLSADYIVDGTTNKVINVKPDWNAASGSNAEILNKPTIPTVPTISTNITNDANDDTKTASPKAVKTFVENKGYLTQHQDISGKENKTAVIGTAKTSSFTASVGNYYKINVAASGNITVTLSTPSDNSTLSSVVFFVTTSTSPSLTFSAASGVTVYRSKNYSIGASSMYEITAVWNGSNWSLTSLELTSV